MSRPILWGAAAVAPVLAFALWRVNLLSSRDLPVEIGRQPPPAAPLCPWRQPARDLETFFPTATGYSRETRILSGLRLELAQRLGRQPTGEENSLPLYRVHGPGGPIGTILVRRVKGQDGAIEIALALDPQGRVCGVRLQRLREPQEIADALQNPHWLDAFDGETALSTARSAQLLAELPAPARVSGQAVIEGVRSLLILFDTAEQSGLTAHHHGH